MVDDLIDVKKCSTNVLKSNATVNALMDINKLKLSSTKCAKIHISKMSPKSKTFVDEGEI